MFQVAQDRAVALAFALVINTQDTDRRQGIGRRFTDAAQQGRRADRHAGAGRQARSRIAAQRQGNGVMRGAQALGMAGPATGDPRQGLAERAARAGVIDASKAPDMHAQDDRRPKHGRSPRQRQ